MCVYIFFSISQTFIKAYTYIYSTCWSQYCYALKTNDTKSGFYLYVYFFLLTPHGNFNVQTHTHKTKTVQSKNKTNKQTNTTTPPPPPKKIVFWLNLLQDAKIPFRSFYLKRKRGGSDSVVWNTLSHREQHQ